MENFILNPNAANETKKSIRIDVESLNSKEFAKLADVVSSKECRELISADNNVLEEIYTDYFVELKRRMSNLKQEDSYSEAVENIKAIRGAENDRIKPEKNFFELALLILDGSVEDIKETKEYKRCVKSSGQDYTKEFVQKNEEDLQKHCLRYSILKRQVQKELEDNTEYQRSLKIKKDSEDDIKNDLRIMELRAKLAIVELKNRREYEEDVDV